MQKKSFASLILPLLTLCLTLGGFSACKDRKMQSLSDMIKNEEKRIAALIAERGFTIKEGQDGQSAFEEGVYYHFKNGVYMRVLDRGGRLAEPRKTTVVVRFRGEILGSKESLPFDNLSKADYQDTEFLYIDEYMQGEMHYQMLPSAPGTNLNSLMCEGVAFPLTMVGDGARVSLIVPFLKGPEIAFGGGAPTYFDEVLYHFSE